MEQGCGNIPKLVKSLDKALTATVLCYSGDCTKCRRDSFVCGGGQRSSWWERSAFLGPHNITCLRMSENDKKLLEEVLKMRLGEDALSDTMFGYDTQSCESFNYSLSKSAPKNTNFSRNFEGRCASAILRFNNDQGTAMKLKLSKMGIQLAPGPAKALAKIGTDMRMHRKYDRDLSKRKQKVTRRGLLESRHRCYMQQRNARHSDYGRAQADHSYSRTAKLCKL